MTILGELQRWINWYMACNGITSRRTFANMAGVDREILTKIFNEPPPYCPSWGVVCAIAMQCDIPPEGVKRDLRPLWDQAHALSPMLQTSQHRAAIRKEEVDTEKLRSAVSEVPTVPLRSR